MASEPIHVNDDSELSRLVDEASERPVRFERKGVVYFLSALAPDTDDEDLPKEWDPEAVREAIRETAGTWSDIDERVIEDLYEWRRIGSRPITRP